MGSETLDRDDTEAPPRRWREAFTLASLFTAAFLLYELTYQPAVGVTALSLKFGWEDFRTARWLWRYDPLRARGRACWWMFVGSGVGKAAGAAMIMFMVIGVGLVASVLLNWRIADSNWLVRASIGAMLTMFAGIVLVGLAGLFTFVLARRGRFKLWLHRSVNQSRRANVWTPFDPPRPAQNYVYALLIMPLMGLFVPIPVVLLEELNWPWWSLLIVTGIFIRAARPVKRMAFELVANSAAECWPPDEPPVS